MPSSLLFVPLVVAQRLPVLWLEAFGLRGAVAGRPESSRMIEEKVTATVQGAFAAQVEWQRLWWETSLSLMRGSAPPDPMHSGRRLAEAALRPAARRVRSNMRRLSRG